MKLNIPALDRDGRLLLRRDETYFRLTALRDVGGIGIVQVGKFHPGTDGAYASANVIGVQVRSDRDGASRRYSLHRLIFADDRGPDDQDSPWYLQSGIYDIPTLRDAQTRLDYLEKEGLWG